MDRALKILASLYATASAVLLLCLVYAVFQYIVPDFANLNAHPKNAALVGLALGYGMMFVLVYALAARHIWRRTQWGMTILLAAASFFGIPIGPVLGFVALVLLTRPAIRAKFS